MIDKQQYLELLPYVSFVVDDAGFGSPDVKDWIRSSLSNVMYPSVLVVWEFKAVDPMIVAVHSYLDVHLDDDEVSLLAEDYLEETLIGWKPRKPDLIVRMEGPDA